MRPFGAAAALLVCLPCAARAQDSPRLESAHARVEVASAGADATVVVSYTIAAPAGVATLGVRAIPFFGLAPGAVAATVDGEPVTVGIGRGDAGGAIGGSLTLHGAATARRLRIELRYVVPAAVARDGARLDIRAPLLLPDAAPASSAEGFFKADLVVPRGVEVTESFPTVARTHETAGGTERYGLSLQVVPSLLRWRAVDGPAPRLSFVGAVDLALLLVIGGLGALGARALARSA